MPRRKENFITEEIYHVIIHAVRGELIFKDKSDYFRGIFSIYEFNNANPVEIWRKRRDRKTEKKKEKLWELGIPTILQSDERSKLVEVLAFSFMPNHIHLLLRQIQGGGISKFMQKVGGGLSRYLNIKYDKMGHLFSDSFKAVHIETDEQLIAVVNYIHGNAISLIESGWKENGIKDPKRVIKFLEEEFRWSSLFDYLGKENFKSVTERSFILELLDGPEGCKNLLRDWISYKKVSQNNKELFLE
jgi:REP element-mobilizing transposase RayT